MAISLERRFAKLFRAYERVVKERDALRRQRDLLIEDQQDQERELKRILREDREREKAASKTVNQYLAMMSYAIQRLARAGDVEAAEKMSEWRDFIQETGEPLVNVKDLVTLLDQWCVHTAVDESSAGALYMQTRKMLNDITGREAGSETVRELQLPQGPGAD